MTGDPQAGHAQRAAWVAAATAGSLALLKLAAGWLTGSLAVTASSLDSLTDTLASGTNALAIRWSHREPTRMYAFGYGKLQALAGLLQGAFITASGLGLAWAAADRLGQPRALSEPGFGITAMLVTAAVSAALAAYLRRSAGRTGTPLLEADALHYASDLWANAGAVAAILLEHFTNWRFWDPVISLLLVAWILRGALKVAAGAISELLDHGLPEAEAARVAEVVARYAPDVRGFHDLRTRRSGHRRFFDFHVVIRPDIPFVKAHFLTDRIIQDLEAAWPGADVTVHPDPEPDARLPYGGQGWTGEAPLDKPGGVC